LKYVFITYLKTNELMRSQLNEPSHRVNKTRPASLELANVWAEVWLRIQCGNCDG